MNKFALIGNGPISNRGCEAIILGTRQILEKEFGPSNILLASFAKDSPKKLPERVDPMYLPSAHNRWSLGWTKYRVNRLFHRPEDLSEVVKPLQNHLGSVDASLTIGGDGYAIEYGHLIIDRLVALDRYIQSQGIPVIIWGASIGPFSQEPQFEKKIAEHFSHIDLIVVREPVSYNYLRALGLGNVFLAPDPAFTLEPVPCPLPLTVEKFLREGCIGINLSPLLSKFAAGGNLEEWTGIAARALSLIIARTGLPMLLIPHVTSADRRPYMDDELFLEKVMALIPENQRIRTALISGSLTSQNFKWVIGQTKIFVGARMHSSIAALSMNVPSLTIAYSVKAWGVNEYVFGHRNWVFSSEKFETHEFCDRVIEVLEKKDQIRSELTQTIPNMISLAYRVAREIKKAARL